MILYNKFLLILLRELKIVCLTGKRRKEEKQK